MSIQNEIERITKNISDSYEAVRGIGGEIPEKANSENLPAAIRSVPISKIELTANPPGSGTGTGGRRASKGMTVSVEAQGSGRYVFDSWTENDAVVSGDNPYSFPVSGNRSLTAQFCQYMAGRDWFQSKLPYSLKWTGLDYGAGRFVAVADGSAYTAYSTDGRTWVAGGSLPSAIRWYYIGYGNGRFIVTPTGNNKTAYSTNGGASWTSGGNLPVSSNWTKPAYGAGKTVVLSITATGAYSTNGGVSWTATTLPSSALWNGTVYGNGRFLAVSYDSNKAIISTDGINWISATLPSSELWVIPAYGNGKFVTFSRNGGKVISSTDGIIWTPSTLPDTTVDWISVAYVNGMFVAIANSSAKAAYSADGINWTATTLPVSGDWGRVCGDDNKRLVAIGGGMATYNTLAAYSFTGNDTPLNAALQNSGGIPHEAKMEPDVITAMGSSANFSPQE